MKIISITRVACLLLMSVFGCGRGTDDVCDDANSVVVEEGSDVKMVVSPRPYAHGSIQIMPVNAVSDIAKWSPTANVETRDMINRVAAVWASQDVAGYLVYGKNSPDVNFNWHVVPYPKSGSKMIKHLKVLWNVTFGSSCISQDDQREEAQALADMMNALPKELSASDSASGAEVKGDDVFCKPEVIKKQLIFEGKDVFVIYNYAPIELGEEKLHFLILPKQHRLDFTDLTKAEYLETMQLTQRIVRFYQSKGLSSAYIYNKTGSEAGQTVPHWHQHVILGSNTTQEFFGKLSVLKKMLLGASPLPDEELKRRVETLRNELADPLLHD